MPLPLRSTLAVLAFSAASAATTGVHAAEFGDASVRSFSGQPLSADIELTDLTAQELADLQVRLARPDVFRGANVKMSPALADAGISIVRRDNRRVLHVTTSAPVQGDVLHLYFQLVSGGKERVRSVSLWLSPDPNPAPKPAPAAPATLAATPAPVERDSKPAARRAGHERPVALVAMVSPGKEATAGERELLGAVERAFGAHGGKVAERQPAKAVSAKQDSHKPEHKDVRKEALKYASTADDFKRGAKPARPAVAERKVAQEPAHEPAPEPASEPAPEKKAPQRSFLASKAELAEAARATRASVEGARAPAAPAAPEKSAKAAKAVEFVAQAGPAAAQPDMAMLNKLSELEGKLKTLQAQLGITSEAGAARVAVPVTGKPAMAPEAPKPADPAPAAARTPDVATVAAAAAAQPAPAAKAEVAPPAQPAQPEEAGAGVAAGLAAAAAVPAAPVEEAKAAPEEKKPEEKKEAAPPPEPRKEIKISRPKLLMFLFAGFLVLVGIFGVTVHVIRKKKMQRSPIVRQSWSRDEDDAPVRIEPAIAPAAPPESKVA